MDSHIYLSRKLNKMNLKRITDVYQIIKNRLPRTYKTPKLAFYEDEDSMLANNKIKKLADEATVYALINPNTLTINLPFNISLEYTDKYGQEKYRHIRLNQLEVEEIASILLHECAHVQAGERYGYNSKQYHSEAYCDKFAKRWVNVLKKEKLI